MRKLLITNFILIFGFLIGTNALYVSTPFVTRTPNRYEELVVTQDAYEPVSDIRTYNGNNFNTPQDLYIDDEDYLYVLDTGNKAIVIFDNAQNFLMKFEDPVLTKPMGIFVKDDIIYVADYGLNEDLTSGRIHIFEFDKVNEIVQLKNSFARPDSQVLLVNDYIFRPLKIAVDNNHTMYVVSEGSYNGIMMINSENRFLNFFATNSVGGTVWDRIMQILYGNNEKAQLSKKIPPSPTNVFLKDTGYVYTVTQTVINDNKGDTLKKVNNGGINFFPSNMLTSAEFSALTMGSVENIYAVTKTGYIYEFDREGNLLFVFAGPSQGLDRLGLFRNVSSISINSKNEIYVLDDANNNIHILKPTAYANVVHEALHLYNQGKYVESQGYWEEVLKYNALFDLAHEGIGRSYFMQGQYKLAMEKFKIADEKTLYSEAMWEVRNVYLQKNAGYWILGVVLALSLLAFMKSKRSVELLRPITNVTGKIKNTTFVKEMTFMKSYLKTPLDSCYEAKVNQRVSILSGIIFLVGLMVIYIVHLLFTGMIFRTTPIEDMVFIEEIVKVLIPIVTFVFANYLTSSLMEGEGRLKSIFINTLGALTPVYVILPILVILSNVLTLNEGFIYYFGFTVMFIWLFILLFFMIKDTHNFSVKETILNIILTAFIMIIMIIVAVMFYMMIMQVIDFVTSIIKEVIINA